MGMGRKFLTETHFEGSFDEAKADIGKNFRDSRGIFECHKVEETE